MKFITGMIVKTIGYIAFVLSAASLLRSVFTESLSPVLGGNIGLPLRLYDSFKGWIYEHVDERISIFEGGLNSEYMDASVAAISLIILHLQSFSRAWNKIQDADIKGEINPIHTENPKFKQLYVQDVTSGVFLRAIICAGLYFALAFIETQIF